MTTRQDKRANRRRAAKVQQRARNSTPTPIAQWKAERDMYDAASGAAVGKAAEALSRMKAKHRARRP